MTLIKCVVCLYMAAMHSGSIPTPSMSCIVWVYAYYPLNELQNTLVCMSGTPQLGIACLQFNGRVMYFLYFPHLYTIVQQAMRTQTGMLKLPLIPPAFQWASE